MWLWISVSLLIAAACLFPFSSRLHNTGLWAGRSLLPDDAADAYPQGLQDALTTGWPSIVAFIGVTMPFTAIGISVLHAWWMPIVMLVIWPLSVTVTERIQIASPWVDRYLMILLVHALKREADYARNGDAPRAEAARELAGQVGDILDIYLGKKVPAPSIRMAKESQYGDPLSLLKSGLEHW